MINDSNQKSNEPGIINHCSKNIPHSEIGVLNLRSRPKFTPSLGNPHRTIDLCQQCKKCVSSKNISKKRQFKREKSVTQLSQPDIVSDKTQNSDNTDQTETKNNTGRHSSEIPASFDHPRYNPPTRPFKFPFTETPSGCLKIIPDQLVYNSNKIGIVVADPAKTKIDIQEKMPPSPNKFFSPSGNLKSVANELFSRMNPMKPDYTDEDGDGPGTLCPEIKLDRLVGYNTSNSDIDYARLALPTKTNLYQELYRRISNYLNTDVQVIIGEEEFSCHSMVLQSYSEFFEKKLGARTVELPAHEVSVNAFIIVYDWMITGTDCVNLLRRDNILEVFQAAQFLSIKELEEQCWAFLDSEDVFTEDTAFMLYIDAKQKHISSVKELMIPRIRSFFLMLVSSQDYVELELDEVCILLSSNYIAVNCEMEVLMSAVRWLKYDWVNRLKHIVKILSCIRFGLIAPWQLVDVKRNPENPELLEIMAVPEIVKMVDDGLSFVIIKYWYGHKTEDYSHWIELLGLTEPHERNWAGNDKSYVTYKQFLSFLDTHRRDHMLEKTKLKLGKAQNTPNILADYPPVELVSMGNQDMQSYSGINVDPILSAEVTASDSQFTVEEAASMIQSAYRSYRNRNLDKHIRSQSHRINVPKPVIEKPVEQQQQRPIYEQNLKVLSMFATHRHRQTSPEQEIKKTSPRKLSCQKYLAQGSLFNLDRESILLVGGVQPHKSQVYSRNTGRDIYRYMPENNTWDYVAEMPEPRQNHATVFFKGRVYLAGGANPAANDVKVPVMNTMWSFEPVKKTWHHECPMIARRKNFGLVACNTKLYAIGGQGNEGKMLASVERYEGGLWIEVAPLISPRMGAGYAKYRDSIFVAGGMVSKPNRISDTVESYDIRRNEWTRIVNLRSPRCCMPLITMNDTLYVIGGAIRIGENGLESIPNIDMWNPRENKWDYVEELGIARHGHCVAYLGMQIFILGGITTEYMRALSNTECYCCERKAWIQGIAPLPLSLSGHSSVTLPPASLL